MNLVIAEKDGLARDIARAICGVAVNEKTPLPQSGNGYTVIGASGHLLAPKEPAEINERYKEWCIEDLPIVVENWPKAPESDFAARKLARIEELLKQCDGEVIHAGDPDDEGQLIVDEILEHLGYDPSAKNVLRVYVSDSIDKNIIRSFERMIPNADCRGAGYAAYARQMGDICFGYSESRLAAIRMNKRNVSLGRVQTPTLGMVVKRDLAIENHVCSKYYRLFADCTLDSTLSARFEYKPAKELLEDGKHIFDRALFEAVKTACADTKTTANTAVKVEKAYPPLPYNMTTLQADMSTRFKLAAQQTLDVTQALRDKYDAITYNRSDCEYLTTEHFTEAPAVVKLALKNIQREALPCDFSTMGAAFCDDAVKVHFGIIPQEKALDVEQMSEIERNVYTAITERYAMQFLPPEQTEVSLSTLEVAGEHFECRIKRQVDVGYLAHFPRKREAAESTGDKERWIEAGEHSVDIVALDISEHETTPPKPYTEGTLITDMASIAKYVTDPEIKAILKKKDEDKASKVEKGGIGTSATRGNIIKRLKDVGYIEEVNGKLRSTEKGRRVHCALPPEIGTADTTAKWWLIQQQVASGTADVNAIQRSVAEVFEQHKDTAYIGVYLDKVVGACPKCGEALLAGEKAYTCSTNRSRKQDDGTYELIEGCGFKITPINGKLIAEEQVGKLLKSGKTDEQTFVSKKTGKPYKARLTLSPKKDVELSLSKKKSASKKTGNARNSSLFKEIMR